MYKTVTISNIAYRLIGLLLCHSDTGRLSPPFIVDLPRGATIDDRSIPFFIPTISKHQNFFWLVVSTYPSEKYDFVSWHDDIANCMEK